MQLESVLAACFLVCRVRREAGIGLRGLPTYLNLFGGSHSLFTCSDAEYYEPLVPNSLVSPGRSHRLTCCVLITT